MKCGIESELPGRLGVEPAPAGAAQDRIPQILDGGLATTLEARGCRLHPKLWSAGLLLGDLPEFQHEFGGGPAAIQAAHRAFLEAGADIIVSCGYQATLQGFRREGLSLARSRSLLRLAVNLAVDARDEFWETLAHISGPEPSSPRGGRRFPLVAAGLGTYGAWLADGSEYTGNYGLAVGELRDFHRDRIAILAGSGADMLACETIPSLPETEALASLLAEVPDVPSWISFACRDGASLNDGSPIEEALQAAETAPGLVAVGVNCTRPEFVQSLIGRLRSATELEVFVYPNSGEAYDARSRTWSTDRQAVSAGGGACLAEMARGWVAAGATGIGGCCRVPPDQIRQIRRELMEPIGLEPTTSCLQSRRSPN